MRFNLYACVGIFLLIGINCRSILHEQRSANSVEWQKCSKAPSDMIVPMTVAMAQQNLHMAEQSLMRVSDPQSSEFSQYWSPKKVAQTFAPTMECVLKVIEWLRKAGIEPTRLTPSHSAGLLSFNATIKEVEKLLETEYHLYERGKSGEMHAACDEYRLPANLQQYVDFVSPTIHLPSTIRRRKIEVPGAKIEKRWSQDKVKSVNTGFHSTKMIKKAPMNCYQYTTLDCLRALYHIPLSETAHPNNSIGVVQLAWVSWLPADLDSFFRTFMPSLVGSRPKMELIDGGYWQDVVQAFPFNAEPDLDFEYAMSLVYPQTVTNYQIGDKFLFGTLNNLLAALDETYCGALDPAIDPIYPNLRPGGYNMSDCGTHKPTNVISISYAHDEFTYPVRYEKRQCLEWLKLGLQGVSVIVSTADYGVAGQSNKCIDWKSGRVNGTVGRFNPTFPASCPYVTSVGGTQLPVNSSVYQEEESFYQVFGNTISSSGGGFSNVFSTPPYQFRQTQRYLSQQHLNLSNWSSYFNSTGRGFPDVSANAANYITVINGKLVTVFGTSASTPVFASIITKINNERLSAGKKPVGFLNPTLYRNPHVMNDISQGFNYGCGAQGFKAADGWDPVTGLGTPDYEKLLELYMNLP